MLEKATYSQVPGIPMRQWKPTSGIRRFDYLVQAVKRAGAHKVLFGTDGPWLHPGVELHKVHLLGLPPKQEALILGENLLRLIRGVKTSPRTRAGAEYKLA
jgi:predicted TIM-barrel fold metal-dependent hydrolase